MKERIERIERTLVAIYDSLPLFVKMSLMTTHTGKDADGPTVEENIDAMRKDLTV